MTTPDSALAPPALPAPSLLRRLSGGLHRHPRVRLGALLAAPVGWLVVAYLGSLALFFVSSFWTVDSFTGNISHTLTLDNYVEILTGPIYRTIAVRTVVMAVLVTLTTIVLAFPIAFYMAKVASAGTRGILVVSILLPLWSGYLVKVYAWRIILGETGFLNGILGPLGLRGPGFGDVAVWLVETYLWLPYMVIPIYAGLERVPDSLVEASSDLGARTWTTFRRVVFPLVLPAMIAGSIFTFSLTLGDYITPTLVSNTRFMGNVIYDLMGVAGNQPLAAAYAMVPVVIMITYLLIARRIGAFEAL